MGKPAARVGDMHVHPTGGGPVLPPGVPNVLIGGLPAAVIGNPCQHNVAVDAIVQGEPTVLIGGRPASGLGDKVACGGPIVSGCVNVWIGSDPRGECLGRAAQGGSPFVKSSV